MFLPRMIFSCRLRLLCLPCLIFPGILKFVFLPFSCSWYIKKAETYYEIHYTDFVGFYLTYPCQYKIAFTLVVGIYCNWIVFTGLYVNNCHWDVGLIVSVTYWVTFPWLFRMTNFIEISNKQDNESSVSTHLKQFFIFCCVSFINCLIRGTCNLIYSVYWS